MNYAVLLSDKRTWRPVNDIVNVLETEFFSGQAYAVTNDRVSWRLIGHPDDVGAGEHVEFEYPNGTPEMQQEKRDRERDGKMRDFKPRKEDLAGKLARVAIKSICDGISAGQPLLMTALAREALDKMHLVEGIPQLPTVKTAKASGSPENLQAVLNAEYGAIVATSSPALKAAVKYADNGE